MKTTKLCPICKNEFQGNSNQKTCSTRCSSEYKKTITLSKTKICEFCKKEFNPRGQKQKFCSQECKDKSQTNICPICNKEFINKYNSKTCSLKCGKQYNLTNYYNLSEVDRNKIKEKRKNTNLERYGISCVFEDTEYIRKKTFEKRGYENTFQNLEFQRQIKEDYFKEHGCYPAQNPEVKKKIKETVERNKESNPDYYKEIVEKVKKTKLERYGNENYCNSEKISKEWKVKTKEEIAKIVDKRKRTCLDKNGYECYHNAHILNKENLTESYVRRNFIRDNRFLRIDFEEYFNISGTTSLKYKRQFGITEPDKENSSQLKLFDSILVSSKLLNDRTILDGKELDIYLPDHNLAIEFNGLMFHSQGSSTYSMFNTPDFPKDYHLKKMELCKSKNIQLLHILEGEDLDLWLSVINNKLGLSERIFARKCIVKELSSKEVREFLNSNHLQGSCNASINLGLFYKDELVSVMTLGKSRFNKSVEYELFRFCSKKSLLITGGASKLLKYFETKYRPKSLISYANLRWSDGNLYRKLGFTEKEKSAPNYFYFQEASTTLYPRIKFQKHKLEKLLERFDPNKTEWENMQDNGYRRIYDCGNLVFVKEYKND